MNIALYSHTQSPKVQKMLDSVSEIQWWPTDAAKHPSDPACDYLLYVISPKDVQHQQIPACIPTLIDNSNKNPRQTLYCYLSEDDDQLFTKHQLKSLEAIGKMVEGNGALWLKQLPMTLQQWQAVLDTGAEQ